MMIIILGILRYGLVLIFGVGVSLLFGGLQNRRRDKLVTAMLCVIMICAQMLLWSTLGMKNTMQMYPLIVHFPVTIFLVFYFKRSWLISISSVLSAYLCCQIPRWIGTVMLLISGNKNVEHISYIIAMGMVYYFLKKYVADSVKQLMERSIRSCLLFAAVPLLYYIFDYSTTIYTDLLYSGAKEAVQFTPSFICTFYFVFVILYYNESKKQIESQYERDILASQLHQAKIDLDNMMQMQNNTMIYRHDMRHHLSLIKGLVADGDMQKLKEYLSSAEADIDLLTPIRYCENETVNLILSTFNTRAKKEGVVMIVDVKLPNKLSISDTELCSLVSNALDNAIAAASQLNDEKLRKVYVRAVVNSNKLIISTENAYDGKIELEGDLPKSKNKKNGHGFGIKSIVSIIERHDGLYSFETEDGVFILQLLLPLNVSNL